MSKPKHPYPLPVRVAVAETIAKQVLVMREWSDLTQQTRYAFLGDADEVLTSLWDASRVDTVEQLVELPDTYYVIDANGYWGEKDVFIRADSPSEFPLRIIYWGDSGE